MTTVAILQPCYLPWVGHFDIIDQADVVVFLDTVQLEKQSWQTRNRVLAPDDRVVWLSIPTTWDGGAISEARIASEHGWERKHLRTLEQCYARCDHWHHLDPIAERLTNKWSHLADLTAGLTMALARIVGIECEYRRAKYMGATREGRVGRIADLLRLAGATEFLEPAGGRDLFTDNIEGVPVRFHEYEPVEYRQNRRDRFVPRLSVVDALARHGPERTRDIIRAGRR